MQSAPNLIRNAHVNGGMNMHSHVDPTSSFDMNPRNEQAEMHFAKLIGDCLYKAYPGYLWAVVVQIDKKNAGAQIKLPVLMGGATCYSLPLTTILSAGDLERRVKEAGGHILERFRIPRSGMDVAAFLHARDTMQIKTSRDRMPE
jgi:hypothetical protein